MKHTLFGLITGILIFFLNLNIAYSQDFFLKELHVEGNRITKTRYIMSCITLREGRSYSLEKIMDEIIKSKKNLMNTNLFTDVFFNDEIDENNNIVLVIKVREKNYLHFRPSGYIYYKKDNFHIHQGLYVDYTNLFGNAAGLELEIPFFDTTGFYLKYSSTPAFFQYKLAGGYFSSSYHEPSEMMMIEAEGAFSFNRKMKAGLNSMFFQDMQKGVIFSPFFEWGSKTRPDEKVDKWKYLKISPSAGYNFSGSNFYTFSSELHLYYGLLLRMIYLINLGVEIQTDSVPEGLKPYSMVRGTDFSDYRGTIYVWLTNELRFPLPWNSRMVIVPFFDLGAIGEESFNLLAGGGVGFRWFTRYTDPLLLDFAVGKGIMLNFQKKF